jgi:hypothetical protein
MGHGNIFQVSRFKFLNQVFENENLGIISSFLQNNEISKYSNFLSLYSDYIKI